MIEKQIKLRAEIWGSDMDRYVLKHPVEEIDDFIVDVEAFFKTRSTCVSCGNSCTSGTTIPEETAQKLAPILDEIKLGYIPKERWNSVGWSYSEEYKTAHTNIVELEDGHKGCSFLYKKEGKHLCAIYSWALEKQVPIFDYWPFECIMYPIAVMPYKGLLYPNKTLLTLRLPQNWELVDIYGDRPNNNSVYSIWRKEIKKRIRKKLRFIPKLKKRSIKEIPLEAHFCEIKDWVKPLSYVYYGRVLTWYLGEEFYAKLCERADKYLNNSKERENESSK
ncbi:MAG: hypothetical protein O6940_06800 [Ignavibacteria bacterium]|nr:hypothetical protein [Ignavibacteria bacterium]